MSAESWARTAGSRAEAGVAVREAQPLRPSPSPSIIADAVCPRRQAVRSVATIAARRFDAGERLQIEIDDRLQGFGSDRAVQRVG
jgi:hypothetical protein